MVLLVVGLGACKGPMAKIEALRDEIAADDVKGVSAYPMCTEQPPFALPAKEGSPYEKGCFAEIANALGSKKGFVADSPDQAAAATAAIILVREGRGDWLARTDTWIGLVKTGKSAGVDALRAAVALKMAETAPLVGRHIEEENDARATMKGIAAAIPGACPTYFLYGTNADVATMRPELTADHAACVQRDLSRREGVGASYGAGTFRALEGSLSIWREAERALRLGLEQTGPQVKPYVEKKLLLIEEATRKNDTKKMAPVRVTTAAFMGEVHADAGVILFRDAGADGAAEAGAPAIRRPNLQ